MTTETIISREAAVTAVKRWFDDIWTKKDMQAVDEVLAPNFDYVLTFIQTSDRDAFKRILETNHVAFENLIYWPDEIIVDGNTAAARWRMHTSKHRATWNNVEATGNEASIPGMTFFYFANGQIAGVKILSDFYSLMRQLDVIT